MEKTGSQWFEWALSVVLALSCVTCFPPVSSETGTCGEALTEPAGSFHSPGYPALHVSGPDCNLERSNTWCNEHCVSYCIWTISTDPHKNIHLSFSDFNIAEEDWCCPNYLEIRDGPDEAAVELASYCGVTIPSPVVSTGNTMYIKLTTTDSTPGIAFNASWETGCASKILQTSNGTVESPSGFPNPLKEDGSCMWTITVQSGFVIDLTFDNIALGPTTNNQNPPCDGDWVTTSVSLYDSEITEKSKLLERYCTRNAQPGTITTTSNHLTIVFTTRNSDKINWDEFSEHGFKASYVSRESNDGPERQTGLFLHGSNTKDKKLAGNVITNVTLGKLGNRFSMPLGNERKRANTVNVHHDGKLSFNVRGSSQQNYLCVYCTDIDSSAHEADIWYNVHTCDGNTDSDNIIQRVCDKANSEIKEQTHETFNAFVVVVVTWVKVNHRSQIQDGDATFQLAVASDGFATFAFYIYREAEMKWNRFVDITMEVAIVYDGNTRHDKMVYSNKREALNVDTFKGNTGRRGTWIYTIGNTATPDKECDSWYNRNLPMKEERAVGFARLPECPCDEDRASRSIDWVDIGWKNSRGRCYRLSSASSRQFLPYSKTCCYNGMFVADPPGAGHALAYNPSYTSIVSDHLREDEEAYQTCCVETTNKDSCGKFYELRPTGKCNPNPPWKHTWMCCDPHIITMDERDYVFNGWGEYTLVSLNTAALNFTLQGRTDLAETESGKVTNATVFTAFGAQENGTRAFIGLDTNDWSSLVIYVDGRDYSLQFMNKSANFMEDTEDFKMFRNNDSLVFSFPSGIGLTVSARMKSLAVSVNVPVAFQGQTRGLLGDFNGNKDDDFILPDGTMLETGISERDIFNVFGRAWAVDETNTVMRYGPRKGPGDYAHPDFVPIFLAEQPAEVRKAAEDICGPSSIACIYDFVATGSTAFALDSKQVNDEADETNRKSNNTGPLLEELAPLNVTSGINTTFQLQAFDPDANDFLRFHVVDDGNGLVHVNPTSGLVTYQPDASQPIVLSFYAIDSHNAASPVRTAPVIMCSGCSGHGSCDFTLLSYTSDSNYNLQFAACMCEPAWGGINCDVDVDGCAASPCLPQQNCTDLTPEQQGQSEIGFDCGPCPAGYSDDPNSRECIDIDECAESNNCEMLCVNTQGSYECMCHTGYRLDNNGISCWDVNECQERSDNCQHICNNTEGSYICLCEDGYVLGDSGATCTQDATTASVCSNAECSQECKSVFHPSTGGNVPECFCRQGYDLDHTDNKTCLDHDECQDGVCPQQCFNYEGGFACFCYSGYQLSDDKRSCTPCPPLHYGTDCQLTCTCNARFTSCDPVKGCICEAGWTGNLCQDDVNECLDNPNVCDSNQVCNNTRGSYSCSCLDGYSTDSTGKCTDVDECAEDSPLNTCGQLETCNNLPGSFYCTCQDGYQRTNDECTDVDECADGNNNCEQKCVNVPGGYNCDCFYGYRLNTDRVSCTQESDVCAAEEDLSCEHGCTLSDDNDRAFCFCRAGFVLGTDKQTCRDIDECSLGTSGCSHNCTNTIGGFVCSCPAGKKLDNDGKTCLDCPPGTYGSYCTGTCGCGLGSDRCDVIDGCVCRAGWEGERCDVDVDECSTESVLQQCREKNSECLNYPGGYRCQCEVGYEEDERAVCQDIDECLTNVCEQQCENSPGSYRCLCSKGFSMDSNSGSCQDVDECAIAVTNKCTQRCLNTIGLYFCACDVPGYELDLDGVTCTAVVSCQRTDCPKENGGCSQEQCFCNSRYELTSNNTCELEDVDWCAVVGCDHHCEETSDGTSFICSCRPGFVLQDDGTTCNECPDYRYGPDCRSVCTCNMQNTHSCDKVTGACTCKARWKGSTCNDPINECETAVPDVACPENSHCVSSDGTYLCVCDDGYYKTSDGNCIPRKHAMIVFTVNNISVNESDLADPNSPEYMFWDRSASEALTEQLQGRVTSFIAVDVVSLRVGSLIIEARVVVDETSSSMQEVSSAILSLVDTPLTVGGQTGTLTISVNDTDVSSSWTTCDVYEVIESCPDEQECYTNDQQLPECRPVDGPSPGPSNLLVIVLGVTIPLIIFVVIATVICIIKKKKSRKGYSENITTSQASLATTANVPPTSYANPTLYGDPDEVSEGYIRLDQSSMGEKSPYERFRRTGEDSRPLSATPGSRSNNSWTNGSQEPQHAETPFDGGNASHTYQNVKRANVP